MRWQDIDTQCPDGGESGLDELLTYRARLALGFTARSRDHQTLLRGAYTAHLNDWYQRNDNTRKGMFALLAAVDRDWDLVGDCTGGALAGRVVIRKTFSDNVAGLARHLATVARSKLPATHVLAAMEDVRERFRKGGRLDPRVLVLATQLFVRDIVGVDDPIVAARGWLDGEPIDIDAAKPVVAPADGEDPRVKIFERFAPELSADAEIARGIAQHLNGEPWGRHLERDRGELDDLVIRAYVARLPLQAGWDVHVDPIVAAWLGGEAAGVEQRLRDLVVLRGGSLASHYLDDALFALLITGEDALRELVAAGKLPKYKPGQFFKEDARKLVRYLASAIAAGGTEDAVTPAWFDFLARRSPATTPRLATERVLLRWKHLLLLQAAITERIGKRGRAEVGRALQLAISGA